MQDRTLLLHRAVSTEGQCRGTWAWSCPPGVPQNRGEPETSKVMTQREIRFFYRSNHQVDHLQCVCTCRPCLLKLSCPCLHQQFSGGHSATPPPPCRVPGYPGKAFLPLSLITGALHPVPSHSLSFVLCSNGCRLSNSFLRNKILFGNKVSWEALIF